MGHRYRRARGSRADSHNRTAWQAHVAAYLRDAGLAVRAWDLDDALRTLPEGGDSGVPFAGRPNVAAVQGGAGGGRSQILNGHIDVVSPEPLAAWTRDPWGRRSPTAACTAAARST